MLYWPLFLHASYYSRKSLSTELMNDLHCLLAHNYYSGEHWREQGTAESFCQMLFFRNSCFVFLVIFIRTQQTWTNKCFFPLQTGKLILNGFYLNLSPYFRNELIISSLNKTFKVLCIPVSSHETEEKSFYSSKLQERTMKCSFISRIFVDNLCWLFCNWMVNTEITKSIIFYYINIEDIRGNKKFLNNNLREVKLDKILPFRIETTNIDSFRNK